MFWPVMFENNAGYTHHMVTKTPWWAAPQRPAFWLVEELTQALLADRCAFSSCPPPAHPQNLLLLPQNGCYGMKERTGRFILLYCLLYQVLCVCVCVCVCVCGAGDCTQALYHLPLESRPSPSIAS
jgi:hypothetical protein